MARTVWQFISAFFAACAVCVIIVFLRRGSYPAASAEELQNDAVITITPFADMILIPLINVYDEQYLPGCMPQGKNHDPGHRQTS